MYVTEAVRFLNENKEGIKNILSFPTFMGIFLSARLYYDVSDLYADLKGRITKEMNITPPSWSGTAGRVFKVMRGVSILLSSLSSRPGQAIVGRIAIKIVGEHQLVQLFGPNVNFVTNPYHPKHVISLAAFLLSIPGTLQSLYEWIPCNGSSDVKSLQDRLSKWLNIYNAVTGRPLLHLANLALSN